MELSKDGFSILFGLDGAKLGGNDVEGFNDLGGVELSLFELGMIVGSLFNEGLLLFVEDVELQLLVHDFGFEVGFGGGEGSNLVG